DVHSARHIQELESHVTTRQRIIVVGRFPAGWSSVNGAPRCEIRTVYRVEDIRWSQLEHLRRRVRVVVDECRIVEAVLEEISEVVHLIVAQAKATRRSRSSGMGKPGRQRPCGGVSRVLWHTSVEVPHRILHSLSRPVISLLPSSRKVGSFLATLFKA